MTKLIDLTGKTFGKLTVIRICERKDFVNDEIRWECLCDCGNEEIKIVPGNALKNGHTQSCGCLKVKRGKKQKDLSGMKFGRLTAICQSPAPNKNKNKCIYYLCKCDCGNEKNPIVRGTHLSSGRIRSCGCFHDEIAARGLNPGESALNALFGSYIKGADYRGLEFSIDKDLFIKLVNSNCYYCGKSPSNFFSKKDRQAGYVYNGIDRVDNDKGYIVENCVPCCKDCNYLKGRFSREDFIEGIIRIYKNLKLKDVSENE